MIAAVTRLILTSFLIIFLIGGGRVCGCEALSWIGIDCHKSGKSESCDHHHHNHHDGGEDDNNHSHSDEPASGQNCCEQSLKLVNGEIPKHLSLPEISDFSELAPISFLDFNPVIGLVTESQKRWKQPPSHIPAPGHSRLLQQRFNV